MTKSKRAPELRLDTDAARLLEVRLAVENVINSAMSQARKHERGKAKGKSVKAPAARAYAEIVMDDLAARGFGLR